MQIINTAQPVSSDTLSQLALYSGMDVLTLFEIKDGLSKLMDENRWAIYNFEMELQSPLLAMSLVGIPVDEAARREMTIQFTKEQTHLTVLINKMLSAIGYFEYYRNMAIAEFATHVDYSPLPKTWDEWLALPIQTRRALKEAAPEALVVFQKALKEFSESFNPVSPAQKLKLFYSFFGSPSNTSAEGYFFSPPWLKTYGIHEYKTRNTKNEYEPAVNREALEKIIKAAGDDPRYAAYWAAPFAHVCLAISDLSKSLGFLKCKLEHGLFKASFGAVTETGRLSSRQNAQGFGCFPPGAEALTQTGWKLIEHITDGELVMQSDSYGNLSWAPADTYSATFEGKLHHVQTEQASFTVTPEHRLLMQEHTRNKGDPYVCYATKLFEYNSTRRVTTSGRFEGTNTVHPLVVALLADGSQDGSTPTYWRISFKKIRKINRFLQLIKDAGLSYNELKAKEGYRRFSLHIPPHWPTQWGEWVLSLSLKNAKDLLHELGYWDGTHRGDSIVFYTAKKHRAKWVQTLAHLVGYSSTIVEQEQSVGSWSDTLMYHVNIRPRDFAIVEPKHKSYIEYAGPVYCLTVPSSYFLVRQHDKVFITGNSNAQNVTPKLRHIFVAPPNEKFIVVDYAQIESRIVAAICFRLFGGTNYLAMTECLTGDHEVLTPNGWVKICEKPNIIACWSAQDQSINFAAPLRWIEYETQETMTIKTKYFSLTATPDHILPYKTSSGNSKVSKQPIKETYTKTQFHVQLSGNYSGGTNINPVYAQLLAAYQADGYLNDSRIIEFSFAEERKINRLRNLLQKANIKYTTNWFPGYSGGFPITRFYIKYKDWPITLRKYADNYLLDWAHSALKAYTLEHAYWDDNRERNLSYRVTNKNKTHLEWVATIAHLVGMSATTPIPDHEAWKISIRNSTATNIGAGFGLRYTSNKPNMVYCPTVNTGFFVVRKDGFISITGNCGDAHTLCSSMVWDDLPWPQDFTLDWTIKHGPFPKDMLKAAKKIASEPFYRGKSRRDVSKTLGHGSNYLGKPPHMARQSHIDVKLIEHYQSVYFSTCPELPQWHQWVVQQVQTKGEIVTMLGRARRFFGRPNDDATIREAVAYEPQSVAADYCNNALLRLHKLWLRGEFPATIRLSKHDELVVTCNESLEERVLEIMREQMEEHITLVSPAGERRDWFVPAECESGWNLGRKSDSNPNGIGHPLDGRKRVESGGWKGWKF